ncbi:hypothetical protein [Thermomonospora curvata]|nr:hypothetical protein [Thermomonospora curvata]
MSPLAVTAYPAAVRRGHTRIRGIFYAEGGASLVREETPLIKSQEAV